MRQLWSELMPEREQIRQYAEAFYGLSRLFQSMPCQKERLGDDDLEGLFAAVRECACSSCRKEQQCWEQDYYESCRRLYELQRDLEQDGQLSGESMQWLAQNCAEPAQIEQVVWRHYGQARQALMWKNRMMEQRMAAGEQIYQTAELLRGAADNFREAPERAEKIRRKLRREFHYMGIELEGVRVFLRDGKRSEIYLALSARRNVRMAARTAADILSECCGETMRPALDCHAAAGEEPAVFHFVPDTRYQMLCGISHITKSGELVSGDSYTLLQKDTGKVFMSLSDGMGSGVPACRESEKVIELLEQFLDAGFPQETAVRMINSCILLQNTQHIFSTIDLCMVDLHHAGCDLIKSGASATFWQHGREIEVIGAETVPAGILQQADYESRHLQLSSGDSLIMMTDGVLEALPEENREQKMVELIGRMACRNAREYARRLMERVYLMQNMQARDDMTVLVGTIWEK